MYNKARIEYDIEILDNADENYYLYDIKITDYEYNRSIYEQYIDPKYAQLYYDEHYKCYRENKYCWKDRYVIKYNNNIDNFGVIIKNHRIMNISVDYLFDEINLLEILFMYVDHVHIDSDNKCMNIEKLFHLIDREFAIEKDMWEMEKAYAVNITLLHD